MVSAVETTIQRRRILVQGIVQGVGFRPFVYGSVPSSMGRHYAGTWSALC